MSAVTMYTTSWCGYCFRLKKILKAEGISFAEVDIEADPAAAEFVASVNGGNQTVPTLKFADGSTLTNPSGAEVKAKLASTPRSTKWRVYSLAPKRFGRKKLVLRGPGFDDLSGDRDRSRQQQPRR